MTKAGGAVGIPGLYVTDDPGAKDESAKVNCSFSLFSYQLNYIELDWWSQFASWFGLVS